MIKYELHNRLPKLLLRLWEHISNRRRLQLLMLLALMLIVSVLEIVSIGAVLPFLGVLTSPEHVFTHPSMQIFISSLGIKTPSELLFPLTIMFILAALTAGIGRLLLLWATMRLSYAVGADLGLSIYRKTLYQPYNVHISRNSSEVIHSISVKAPSLTSDVILPVMTILTAAFMLTVILSGLFYFDPLVAASALTGFGFIYAIVVRITRRRLLRDSQLIAREGAKLIRLLQEGLGAIRDILINNSQAIYCRIYQDSERMLCHAQGRRLFFGQSPRFIMEALGMLLIAALAYNLASQDDGLAKALPMLGVLALSAQRLMPVLQQAYGAWASIQGGHASLEDALSFLEQPMPANAEMPIQPMSFERALVLRDVCYRYSCDSKLVLNKVNLTIKKGQRVGFIGTTGSGKSTLLDIVMGLLYSTEGSLEVDDVPVTELNRRAWQAHLAHVPQSIFLSDSTIEANIALGVPANLVDAMAVRNAARQAEIYNVIESLPKQYQSEVGERGVRLSGGQRQRIGIARALYKKADVIILDEATSALDNETEAEVMKNLECLDTQLTILIIAHRLTTLKNCSLIVQLEDGKVKKFGTYADVINI